MNTLIRILSAAALVIAAPAMAQTARDDQANARAEMAAGRNMRARDIERQVVPQYEQRGYRYLTFEYDGTAAIYRFRFIRQGRLLFVDTDARTGRVVREQE